MQRFHITISQVLLEYANVIRRTFEFAIGEDRVCLILLNNIQQSGLNLEKLYESMGGVQLDDQSKSLFDELQRQLSDVLDELSSMFVKSIQPTIRKCIEEVYTHLHQIKDSHLGTGNSSKQQKDAEAMLVTEPLIYYLYQRSTVFTNQCEKPVLKRLLKELWKTVTSDLKNIIVCPPFSYSKHLLTVSSAKIEDVYRLLFEKFGRDTDRNLTQKQCQVLNRGLEHLKECFHELGQGLKQNYLEKTSELQSLRYALALYTQTTDSLIKTFIKTEKEQGQLGLEQSLGEVSIQVDLFTHPSSGEHTVTVKVVAANRLKWRMSGMFHPYVELTMCGPYLSDKKRKYTTKTKSNTWMPKYNETFHFLLGNEEESDCYELNVAVKDYSFMREDRLLGLNVIKLSHVVDQGSWASWIPLGSHFNFDDADLTILRILSHRSNDDFAQEFVRLKSARRHQEDV